MPSRRLLLGLAAAVTLSACTASGSDDDASPTESAVDTTPGEGATSSAATAGGARIVISVEGLELTATLRDTVAARDLLAQLPQTVTMSDHGGVEKTGALARPLAIDGEPAGADPDVADLGYYAPGADLVLYYGDQSYYRGIVILGQLQGDVARLAQLDGELDVTISAL